jgi:hypothetical protein
LRNRIVDFLKRVLTTPARHRSRSSIDRRAPAHSRVRTRDAPLAGGARPGPRLRLRPHRLHRRLRLRVRHAPVVVPHRAVRIARVLPPARAARLPGGRRRGRGAARARRHRRHPRQVSQPRKVLLRHVGCAARLSRGRVGHGGDAGRAALRERRDVRRRGRGGVGLPDQRRPRRHPRQHRHHLLAPRRQLERRRQRLTLVVRSARPVPARDRARRAQPRAAARGGQRSGGAVRAEVRLRHPDRLGHTRDHQQQQCASLPKSRARALMQPTCSRPAAHAFAR